MHRSLMKRIVRICLLLLLIQDGYGLTLSEAECIAVNRADEIRQFEAKGQSLQAQAISEGQLPDPNIQISPLNFPVDTFNFSQEPMTQFQFGINQDIPKGKTLLYRYRRTHNKSMSSLHQKDNQRLLILKAVREQWDLLFFWQRSEQILLRQRKTFKHLKDVASSLFSNNKVPQKDVLNAQLELTQIEERLIQVRQAIDDTRVNLARWIGQKAAYRASASLVMDNKKVVLSKVPKKILLGHPVIKADNSDINSAISSIAISKQDYLPGFSLGAAYGVRSGRNINGNKRPDFLTGQVKISLPLFPKDRQDKKLLASQRELSSLKAKRYADLKGLNRVLGTNIVDYKRTREKLSLYSRKLLPEAKQYANSTLIAYQNDKTDFLTVALGYIRWLDIELAEVKEQVSHSKAGINILYLQGR